LEQETNQTQMNLVELLTAAGRKLREDFQEIQDCNPHAGDRGEEAENILKKFLSERLPKRFGVESGIVIGQDGAISRQCDVIIYDALNSPVYRSGTKLQILPRDNVAAVIEVKSKLNKDELTDAAVKIASVKSIKPSPIGAVDQPVTFSNLINSGTLGCVFAFDSYTTLQTLAENLREINSGNDSDQWIDLVIVLDKGLVGYAFQALTAKDYLMGWLGGPPTDEFVIPPFYVHLVQASCGEKTLNQFFLRLMAHLTFFRKISAIDFNALIKDGVGLGQTIQGYQYNLKRQLVPAQPFQNPKVRYNLYLKKERTFVGQVSLLRWQDGAVIMCSSFISPQIIFSYYFSCLKLKAQFIEAPLPPNAADAKLWMSTVLEISEQNFIEAGEKMLPDFLVVRRDSDDDNPPPMQI
jgi:hypothetical protein